MIIADQVISDGGVYTFTPPNDCTAFDIHNDSPLRLTITFTPGAREVVVSPHSGRLGIMPYVATTMGVDRRRAGVTITITATMPAGGEAPNGAPASEMQLVGYPAPTGMQEAPFSLARLANVGNPVATSNPTVVNNAGNPSPTAVVNGQPAGASSAELTWNNDGSGTFSGGKATVDNNGTLTIPVINSQLQNLAAASGAVMISGRPVNTSGTYFQVKNDGSMVAGAGNLTVNTSGQLVAPYVGLRENASSFTIVNGVTTYDLQLLGFVDGTAANANPSTGNYFYWGLHASYTSGPTTDYLTAYTFNASTGTFTPILQIGPDGTVYVLTPPTLSAGTQLNAIDFGYQAYHPDNGNNYGAWIPFPVALANVPTSITLTLTTASNLASYGVSMRTRHGFLFEGVASAAGRVIAQGTYTTVGN